MASLLEQAEVGPELTSADLGRNPWALAGRRLRRNRIALAALGVFLLIVALSLAAPLYAHYAHLPPPWGSGALNDQNNAGALMWEVGGIASLIAVLLTAAAWFRHDEARQRRIEADLDKRESSGGLVEAR